MPIWGAGCRLSPFGAHALHQTPVTTYEEMHRPCEQKRLGERCQPDGTVSPPGPAEVGDGAHAPRSLPLAAGFAFPP